MFYSLQRCVRSYLEVNCAQCHQPGAAAPGLFDARSTIPTDLAELILGSLINDAGDPSNFWCVPGDTAHSMILKRLEGDGVRRMTTADLSSWSVWDVPANELLFPSSTQSRTLSGPAQLRQFFRMRLSQP